MYLCFFLTNDYILSLILFTIISRIILLPVSLVAYKNSIRLAKIKPRVNDIKRYYSGDKDRIAEEQLKLYKAEKYNPFMDLVPLFIQLFLVIGLIHVMYSPMQYLLQLPNDVITALTASAARVSGVDTLGAAAQLKTLELIQNPAYTAAFNSVAAEWITVAKQFNMSFLGINFGLVPPLRWTIYLLIPVFAGLSSLVLGAVQSKIHVAQRGQGKAAHWGMTGFFTAFASYFAFVVPAGVGFYWGIGNLLSIPVLMLSNLIYKPEIHIDYSSRAKQASAGSALKKAARLREKADYRRFTAESGKKLVFYSAKSGVYKYFRSVLEYVLDNSDIVIHYVTGDPEDAIFSKNHPRLTPYYIGDNKLITLMMNLNTDMMVMTTPDLHKYHIKRSMVRKDIEYNYMFHTVASMHMTLREGAVDHYDTIFCVGPHQVREIRKTEEVYRLKPKNLVKCGYGLIDDLTASYNSAARIQKTLLQIMIAPSWQADNILETCIDDMIHLLMELNCTLIVRPHPEFVKRFPEKISALLEKAAGYEPDRLVIETDFSSNASIYESDIMITDWSNIAFEFSYSTKKPSIFIDTPMKVQNANYRRLRIKPLDIVFRSELGVSVKPDALGVLPGIVEGMLASPNEWEGQIKGVVEKYLFNPGYSGKVGGEYIIKALRKK